MNWIKRLGLEKLGLVRPRAFRLLSVAVLPGMLFALNPHYRMNEAPCQGFCASVNEAHSQQEHRPEVNFQFYQPKGKKTEVRAYARGANFEPLGHAFVEDKTVHVVGNDPFSLTVHWHVEGFGDIWLRADRNGELYDYDELEKQPLHLNYELAFARVMRNKRVLQEYKDKGLRVTPKLMEFHGQSLEFLQRASDSKGIVKARISDLALERALKAGKLIELAWAKYQQKQPGFRPPMLGVDSRHYYWSNMERINQHFPELFDYATITHYVTDNWFPPFEPREGFHRWGAREEVYDWLKGHGATVQARPILWFHESVTPEWLRNKSFSELKRYAKEHATAMVRHWGHRIQRWEIANEMHDWANVHRLNPEQITELIRVTAETVRRLQPEATLIVNNTQVFGDYAGMDASTIEGPSRRSPYMFIEDLIEAGVDFDVIGLQLYHPQRDLSDIVRLIERFEKFGKEIMISEMGAPSYYENEDQLLRGQTKWSEVAQGDWAEDIVRVLAVRPSIKVICWYDLTDFRSFVHNGGVLTNDGLPKRVFAQLMLLKEEWRKALGSEARPEN